MNRLRPLLLISCVLAIVAAWLIQRHLASRNLDGSLAAIEQRINKIYSSTRPFPYRWIGAPYGNLSPNAHISTPDDILAALDHEELQSGPTTKILQLRARIKLLQGEYSEAIAEDRSALFREPENTALQLELGIALALRAENGVSPLDYEFALEAILRASQHERAAEILYDTALLFQSVSLHDKAERTWNEALAAEHTPAWYKDIQSRLAAHQRLFQAREQLRHTLSDSPDSYLSNTDAAAQIPEIVLNQAVEKWLQSFGRFQNVNLALMKLASTLKEQFKDWWLSDLLTECHSPSAKKVAKILSQAAEANSQGEHIRAGKLAIRATKLFAKMHNPAGVLRARIEQAYSMDRQWRQTECLGVLGNLAREADERHYVWISAQARLEEITCRTETRKADVIQARRDTYAWVAGTGYSDLELRALSFLTEEYGGYDSRLQVWKHGLEGLQKFWTRPFPGRRGYTFCYTLAQSAWAAGDKQAALAFMEEGIAILNGTPYRQLFALVLSYLGNWQAQLGLNALADETFNQMEILFAQLDKQERKKFWRQAEITHAEIEIVQEKPEAALSRLKQVTEQRQFPYSDFGPAERRRLLPVLGNAYLAVGQIDNALRCYRQILSEHKADLRSIKDRGQRDNAQREVDPAWRGLVEIDLRRGRVKDALHEWEAFRDERWLIAHSQRILPPPDTTLLVYALLPGGLSGWSVNERGIHQRWLDRTSALHHAEQLTTLVANSDSSLAAVSSTAKRAYAELIQPFSSYLYAGTTLIVDADGTLAGVPWAALEDPEGQVLIENFSVAQTVGWTQIATNLNRSNIHFDKLLAIATPQLRGTLARQYPPPIALLPEFQRLQAQLKDVISLKGPDATLGSLLEHAQTSTVFYFGGHGVSYEEFGALLLAPSSQQEDGKFFVADEISHMNLRRMDLAFLAACSSGAGEQSGIVNLDSLSRSFLEAGAVRVVAARWNVNSESTAHLLNYFDDLVLNHKRPAEALRVAELNTRNISLTRHPYYWAAFQVFGTP